jgi:ankyrin repeat protein
MSQETGGSHPAASLPDAANLDWLRKQAKRRLQELRRSNPDAKLADAQFALAKEFGFSSWRALKAHIDALTIDGQLFAAARAGDLATVTRVLDAHPEKVQARDQPYEWSLLHAAAHNGHLAIVDFLLARGLDVNAREKGDNTYAMHWAAAAGHVHVVRRLADAGGDVIGHGDDHELEVIGWATCWDGCDDDAHRAVVDVLLSRGARHHIFSAIAMRLADEVRRIVAANPAALEQQMSRNESYQRPLHFAVRMNRATMVALLLELGADPGATDDAGNPVPSYAMSPEVDRAVLQVLRDHGVNDLVTAVSLGDWETAQRLIGADPRMLDTSGALHLTAKRNDLAAVNWLLEHGANPNARWRHWDADITPLHFAAMLGHADVVRALLAAGADQTFRDSKFDGDAIGWAEHGGRPEIVRLLQEHARSA